MDGRVSHCCCNYCCQTNCIFPSATISSLCCNCEYPLARSLNRQATSPIHPPPYPCLLNTAISRLKSPVQHPQSPHILPPKPNLTMRYVLRCTTTIPTIPDIPDIGSIAHPLTRRRATRGSRSRAGFLLDYVGN